MSYRPSDVCHLTAARSFSEVSIHVPSSARSRCSPCALAAGLAVRRAAASETPAAAATPRRPSRSPSRRAPVESRPIDRFLRVTGSLARRRTGRSQRRDRRTRHRRRRSSAARRVAARRGAGRASRPPKRRRSSRKPKPTPARSRRGSGSRPGQPFDPKRVPDVMNAQGVARLGRGGVRAHPVAARSEGRLAERVRPAPDAGRGRAAAVPDRAERRRSSRTARSQAARARVDARAQVRGRHRRSARRSPGSSPSGSSASATTSRAGTTVATVVRIDPLRVELTVPEQAVSLVKVGQPVRLTVDAYPGEVFEAKVRFVSPSLRADQRALTVEAVAPNTDGRLKPGLFATALDSAAASRRRRCSCPRRAVETVAGTSRVYVVKDGKVEERIVTTRREGRRPRRDHHRRREGRVVAAEPKGRLTDGMPSQRTPDASVSPRSRSCFARLVSHAVARSNLRQASGLRDRPHPLAHRRRRVLVHAARPRPLPEGRLPHRRRHDAPARRRA